jgi:Zn-dependent peptidase ImmA (M78 family)
MMTNNSSKVKRLAEYIALQFDEKITPLEKILEDEELDLFYDNYESDTFDGMTMFDNGKFYIHLNIDKQNFPGSDRGRFTLAHELGHYFIDAHRIGLKSGLLEPHPSQTNQNQYYTIEREADYFASCLLMPESRFRKDTEKKKFNFDVIDFLRTEYKVSTTACALRFADFGNHPIMVVYAENNLIKWFHPSDDFPFKWLINDKIVPRKTVMGEYFYQKKTDDIKKTATVWAMDWFNYVEKRDSQRKFYEYCFKNEISALSVIWED